MFSLVRKTATSEKRGRKGMLDNSKKVDINQPY